MVRPAKALVLVFLASVEFCAARQSAPIFNAEASHIANRLYGALCVRRDALGRDYGADALDPPLWQQTTHLLTGASHQLALSTLDEFLQTHVERQISDPLKRVLLQRDLWAVFDWSAQTSDDHVRERHELQIRLAEVLRRLALTRQELISLPDNYRQAAASGTFPAQSDAANRQRAFLPPDLLQPRGSWVRVTDELRPIAPSHTFACSGRASFLVFLRLPGGRQATLDYLRALWNAPDPWIGSEIDRGDNPNLPQFPVGTQVALLRQMNLFDANGALVSTPITEEIQIRIYRAITSRRDRNRIDFDWPIARKEQDFFEIRLSQAQLVAGRAGGLQAVAPRDAEFPTFQTQGVDVFEMPRDEAALEPRVPILQRCVGCHSPPGIHSVQTRRALLKPNRAQVDPEHGRDPDALSIYPWWQYGDTLPFKQQQYDWGLLNGYWAASR